MKHRETHTTLSTSTSQSHESVSGWKADEPHLCPAGRLQGLVMQSIRRSLRPELLNRLDDIVVFQPLSGSTLRQA